MKKPVNTFRSAHPRKDKSSRTRFIFCLLITGLFSLAVTNTATAAIYYLDAVNGNDSNPGTSTQPWQTLNRAYTWYHGADTKVQEGDTVLLRNGNYGDFREDTHDGQSYLFYRSGWVIYKADTGHSPFLDSISIENRDKWFGAGTGSSYLLFDGLTINDGITLGYCYYVIIQNCTINKQPNGVTGYYQPYWDPVDKGVSGVHTGNITIQNCTLTRCGMRAIDITDGDGPLAIKNNTIHYNSSDGISIGVVNDTLVEGNHIYDLRRFTTTVDIHCSAFIGDFSNGDSVEMPGTDATGIVYDWNSSRKKLRVFNTSQEVFWMLWNANKRLTINNLTQAGSLDVIADIDPQHTDCLQIDPGPGQDLENFIFRNNIIDRARIDGLGSEDGQGIKVWGRTDTRFNHITIENNLFIAKRPLIMQGVGVDPQGGAADVKINNNTFYCTDSGKVLFGDSSPRQDTFVTSFYNNIISRLIIVDAAGGYSWQISNHGNNIFKFSPNGQGADNPFVVNGTELIISQFDGLFKNVVNIDFTLTGSSAAVDFGNRNYAPATDILGVSRDASPDVGAYEYTGPVFTPIENVITVPTDANSIQEAINAAQDTDVVMVKDGIYKGDGNRDIDFQGKAITVRSENGRENCIIDCEGTVGDYHRGFFFDQGEVANSIVDGFTIINGYAYGDSDNRRGGGAIRCDNSSPMIINCTFINNAAAWNGGAINNYYSSPLIDNCEFINNIAVNNDGGGINNGDQSHPSITNCTFTGNSASDWGGAIRNAFSSSPTIKNCLVINNTSNRGSGIFNYSSNPTILNCTISSNTAVIAGGGIDGESSLTKVSNCIIWGNSSPEVSGDGFDISYTNIQGDWDGQGNISLEPFFIDADNDDYHLKSQSGRWDHITGWITDSVTSPCVDAGDPNIAIYGELWPHDSRTNMGTYGGTSQASMSISSAGNIADFNNDAVVNSDDLLLLFNAWLLRNTPVAEDINRDGIVNMLDFAEFKRNLP